jgi:hypothetical protein
MISSRLSSLIICTLFSSIIFNAHLSQSSSKTTLQRRHFVDVTLQVQTLVWRIESLAISSNHKLPPSLMSLLLSESIAM